MPFWATPKETMEQKLDRLMQKKEPTFQERLLQLIQESGMDYVTFYKNAWMDRKLFSQIKRNPDYRPAKRTIFAMIVALKLEVPVAKDLLARAGYAFSPADNFDRIMLFFLENRVFDYGKINTALKRYNIPMMNGVYR